MTIRLAPGEQINAIAQPPCTDLGPDQWVERGRLPGVLDECRNVLDHRRIVRSYRNGCYQHLL